MNSLSFTIEDLVPSSEISRTHSRQKRGLGDTEERETLEIVSFGCDLQLKDFASIGNKFFYIIFLFIVWIAKSSSDLQYRNITSGSG